MDTMGRYRDFSNALKGIKDKKRMGVGLYGFSIINTCIISDMHIEGGNDNDYPNIEVRLSYAQQTEGLEGIDWVDNYRELLFLNNNGDDKWTYNMINKVWDGEYPYTIAIDKNTGEVFFVHLLLDGIILKLFGREEGLYDIIRGNVVEEAPYRIKINEEAMFTYIDGAEGTNYLKDNIYIEMYCNGRKNIKIGKIDVT